MNVIYYIIIIFSISSKDIKTNLDGDILIITYGIPFQYYLFENNQKKAYELPRYKNIRYYLKDWLNKEKLFLSHEIMMNENDFDKINLVLINYNGEVEKRFDLPFYGKNIGYAIFSPDNSLIYVFSDSKESVNNTQIAKKDLRIIDLNGREIKSLNNIFLSNYFSISNTPLSPDGSRLVYKISSSKSIEEYDKQRYGDYNLDKGLFIFSLHDSSKIKIADNGHNAVWSPNGEYIAYCLKSDIMLYNLNTKETTKLYKHGWFESIRNCYWSPDGKYLYFPIVKDYLIEKMLRSYDEKLINMKTKEEVEFNKLNLSWNQVIWWK